MKRRLLFFWISALALTSLLHAVDLKAIRVKQAPKIDGSLSDSVWQSAVLFTDFRMFEPSAGQTPTEKTELRILYDDANLYIGVMCYESEPGRISANTMAHDSGAAQQGMYYGHGSASPSDDTVRVLLDPFQDKRTAYIFFACLQAKKRVLVKGK